MKFPYSKNSPGFTLIEMVVSLGLFTIVLFISTSAFLSIVNADRKSRATRVAIDNLNLALEDVTRKVKTGYDYSCGGAVGTSDCVAAPQSIFAFTTRSGVRIVYKRALGAGSVATGAGCGFSDVAQGCVLRSDDGGTTFSLQTSPEIDITGLKFWVSGSYPWAAAVDATHDQKQPVVIIAIDGALGVNSPNQAGKSAFKIQTTVTSRVYDH